MTDNQASDEACGCPSADHHLVVNHSAPALLAHFGVAPQPSTERDARLRDITAREQAATDGPWTVEHGRIWQGEASPTAVEIASMSGTRAWLHDADFIAHARDDIPWLLAEVTRLTALLAEREDSRGSEDEVPYIAAATRAVMRHYGYTEEQITTAETAPAHTSACEDDGGSWVCEDHYGVAHHPIVDEHIMTTEILRVALEDTLLPVHAERGATIQAVRDLHRPVDIEPSDTICAACSTLRGEGETARYFPFTDYPCETITALDAGQTDGGGA